MTAPDATAGTAGAERARRVVLLIIGLLTAYRLVLAALLPFGIDESYALTISRQFSLSYFDHPPLHLWLIGAWQALTGASDALVLRLPFVLLGALSIYLLARAAEALFSPEAAIWTALVAAVAPVFALVHGVMVLPDGPLLVAAAGLLLVLVPVIRGEEMSRRRWLLAGLMAGLAFLAKYHGALLVAGVFLSLLLTRPGRRALAGPGPWLAALVAFGVSLPVWVWNADHDFASFAFQSGRSNWTGGPSLVLIGRSLLFQSAYLLPWVGVPLALAALARLRRGAKGPALPLVVTGGLIILFFTLAAGFGGGLPHWQMPGWFLLIPVLGDALAHRRAGLRRLARAAMLGSALLVALLGLGIGLQARFGSFDGLVAALGPRDPTVDLMDWDGLVPQLDAMGAGEPRTFIAATNWIRAGRVGAAVAGRWPVLCLCGDARHFAYLSPPANYAGWTGYVVMAPGEDDAVPAPFETVDAPVAMPLERGGHVVLTLKVVKGTGFRP